MSDMTSGYRLGGWWRLFILFVVLWGAYSATVVLKEWPDPSWATNPITAPVYTPEYMREQKQLALLIGGMMFILGPAFLLAVVWVGRWIYRGFRPRQAP